MLSGVLKNDIAVKVSINIMDAFVKMKRILTKSLTYYKMKIV